MEDIKRPFIVNVFFNERIYNPGDTVQGEVELDLRKRMLCDTVSAQFYGAARVFFMSNEVCLQRVSKFSAILVIFCFFQMQFLAGKLIFEHS